MSLSQLCKWSAMDGISGQSMTIEPKCIENVRYII